MNPYSDFVTSPAFTLFSVAIVLLAVMFIRSGQSPAHWNLLKDPISFLALACWGAVLIGLFADARHRGLSTAHLIAASMCVAMCGMIIWTKRDVARDGEADDDA